MKPTSKNSGRKRVENMSFAEIAEMLKKGPMTVPLYPWRFAGIRSKMDQMARLCLVTKTRYRGYTKYSLSPLRNDR